MRSSLRFRHCRRHHRRRLPSSSAMASSSSESLKCLVMEHRFKTSNHSNEQAKRISIEASGDEKIKRTGRRDMLKRRRWLKKHGTEVRFLSYSTAILKMQMITVARIRSFSLHGRTLFLLYYLLVS